MQIDRTGIVIILVFAIVFSAFAMLKGGRLDSKGVQLGMAAFLFATYCGVVMLYAIGKRRKLSIFWQTVLGVIVALTIATIFKAPPEGYALAFLIGLGLGITADKWVKYVQLP